MAIDVGALIPAIVGLGTKVGTAIPGLRKPPKVKAEPQATRLSGQILGAAQSGYGASRGLALRSGLRQAAQAVGNIAGVESQAALAAQQANEKNRMARAERIGQFGTDLAKGLGDMAAISIGPKSKSDLQDTNRPEVDVSPSGFGTPYEPTAMEQSTGLDVLEKDMAAQEQVDQQAFMDDAAQRLQDFRLKREAAGISAPEAAFQPDPTSKLIDEAYNQRPDIAPEVEKELAYNLQMKKLMLAEAERKGMSLAEMVPRVNRRLGLAPGQSLMNPMGLTTNLDVTGEA